MGAAGFCGENLFQKLVDEYGDDFVKLVVAEKSKGVIKEKFTDLNHRSNEKFDDFEDETNLIVDNKMDELDKVYESAKNSLDSTIPGGIATVERLKG